MLLATAELAVTENKMCLPLLPGGVLESAPLANTTPLYGKEVGNGCALQVFKNTFSVREQMLEKTLFKSAHGTLISLTAVFESNRLPLKRTSYFVLAPHVFIAPASA